MGHESALSVNRKNKRAFGSGGEETASDYLVDKGYRIIKNNWRCRRGEIDIIALSPEGITVFVEVKKAHGNRYGTPESWVTKRKQAQLYKLARIYLQQHKIFKIKSRFDVIAIRVGEGGNDIRHLKQAFIPGL